MAKSVTLGPKAGCFRDSSLDLFIAPGDVVQLNAMQLNSPKIRRALNGGHLVFAENPKPAKKAEPEYTPEELKEAFEDFLTKDNPKKKILKGFNFDQLKVIAGLYEIEPEDSDTKESLVDAILESISEE